MTAIKKQAHGGNLKVEYRYVGTLKPNPKNPRTHTPAQIEKLAKLIKANGWTNPILVDGKNGILAGHGRLQAAKQLGMQRVPVIELTGLSAAQKRAYLLADNRAAQDAGWDEDLLASEFAALKDMGFDLELTGFDLPEIAFALEPKEQYPAEPAMPALERKAITRTGDIWVMGAHRLICGDSTKPAVLEALTAGRKASMVFTDPPYGVSYAGQSGQYEVIEGDDKRRGELVKMLTDAFRNAMKHTNDDAGWYIWHASRTRDDFSAAMRNVGLVEASYIIWVRNALGLGWNDYQWCHEPCFYAAKQGVRPAFYHDHGLTTTVWHAGAIPSGESPSATIGTGIILVADDGQEIFISSTLPKGRKLRQVKVANGKAVNLSTGSSGGTVWEVGRDTSGKEGPHPTMKPVELGRRAINNSSAEGEIVLDIFAGSGSTLMAAEQLGRICYAIELDPLYADVIVRRWQELTKGTATHAKEKASFDVIAKRRTASQDKR